MKRSRFSDAVDEAIHAEDRATFLRENAVSVVRDKDGRIERLRAEIRRLIRSNKSLRSEIDRLQRINADLLEDLDWRT